LFCIKTGIRCFDLASAMGYPGECGDNANLYLHKIYLVRRHKAIIVR
jgi:hypothetical protein